MQPLLSVQKDIRTKLLNTTKIKTNIKMKE